MAIDALDSQVRLPFNRDAIRDKSTGEELYRLVHELDDRLQRLYDTINLILSIQQVGVWYSDMPNPATGDFPDGTWRMYKADDGSLVWQKKVVGEWTETNRTDV